MKKQKPIQQQTQIEDSKPGPSPAPPKQIKLLYILALLLLLAAVCFGFLFMKSTKNKTEKAEAESSNNVKSFGAKGNGKTDDTVSIQKAIDKTKGVLVVPPGRYVITKPIFMKSGLKLRGTRNKSIIIQKGQNMAHVILGDAHPWAYDKRHPADQTFDNYKSNVKVKKGSTSISLAKSADAQRFRVGEIVCIRSQKQFDQNLSNGQSSGWAQPDYVQYNKIIKIKQRHLYLADKSLNTINDPQVCKITGKDPYLSYVMGRKISWYAVQNAEVSGITFEGSENGIDRGLCYSCKLEHLKFRNVARPLAVNAIVKSSFSNISGDYSKNALEIKMSSTQSTFKNITFSYKPPPNGYFERAHAMDIGERSVGITIDNITFNVGKDWKIDQRLIGIGDAQDVEIKNSRINLNGGGRQPVFEIRGTADTSKGSTFSPKNYTISNNVIKLGITKNQLAIIAGSKTNPVRHLRFSGNKWTGKTTTDKVAYWVAYVKDWAVTNDSIPLANRWHVQSESDKPVTKNVKFGK